MDAEDHYERPSPRIDDDNLYQAISKPSLTPTNDADKDRCMSIADDAPYETIPMSPHTPADTKPSSSDVTPASLQHQLPVTGGDAGTLDSDYYVVIN